MKRIIAVDPGVSGGICVSDFANDFQPMLFPMPDSLMGITSLLRNAKTIDSELWIEEVPKFCGKFRNESTTAVLFQNVGRIEGIAAALSIPINRVTPRKWQSILGIGTRGTLDSAAWKRKLKNKAEELYPLVDDLTLKTADALLITHYVLSGKP